jgi:regulator of protease activity HflC (stomatin/prohibitin superfamily)
LLSSLCSLLFALCAALEAAIDPPPPQVGIAYDTGKLEVLPPGLHIRNSPTFRFQEFVSVQEQVTRMEPLRVNTNDGIRIMVNAILTFRVDDPVRAYRVPFPLFRNVRLSQAWLTF